MASSRAGKQPIFQALGRSGVEYDRRRIHRRRNVAHIVCIIGNKGGTGKTTLTHLLAHGLGLLGHRVAAALTDRTREPLSKESRLYLPVDARSAAALTRVAAKLKAVDGWFGILDGGGNRPEMDLELARLSNLILLPFRDSHEDMRTVAADLERFPGAFALPSQWPTNPWALEAAQRSLAEQLGDYRQRILPPVPAVSATKLLLQVDVPASLPTPVNNAARTLAWSVLELLQVVRGPRPEAHAGANRSEAAAASPLH